ncbi:histidine phosphatase family protein [Ferrimonas senticii]|uniref:histidine phosphatase family protein n=1 Tax=Ferrimonas senticii TaxID=394566 RepID=UPI00041106CC|nr:histidine phosphatase family protein [Ferrimonas senticii]
MSEILLIRHGQASFGSDNYDRLSDLGQQQARLLGQDLNQRALLPEAVFAGSLERQQHTAQLALAGAGQDQPVITDSGWNEFDFQNVLRVHLPEFADSHAIKALAAKQADPDGFLRQQSLAAFRRWHSGDFDGDYSESHSQFVERVRAALAKAAEEAKHGRLWVASSGGAIAAAVQHLLGLDNHTALAINWQIVNGSVTKLKLTPSGLKLVSINDHALFERHNLVTHR